MTREKILNELSKHKALGMAQSTINGIVKRRNDG